MEARDGAEFREQHLEFQLHHVGQTHNEPRQGEVGDGSGFDLFNWDFSSPLVFLESSFSSAGFSMSHCLCTTFPLHLLDLHTSQTFSCGSPFDVFCLPQLIPQSEKKEKISPQHNSFPQSSLLSSASLCVTGELFFTVCEMTHSFFTKPNKRPHHNAPASSSNPPLPGLTFHPDK